MPSGEGRKAWHNEPSEMGEGRLHKEGHIENEKWKGKCGRSGKAKNVRAGGINQTMSAGCMVGTVFRQNGIMPNAEPCNSRLNTLNVSGGNALRPGVEGKKVLLQSEQARSAAARRNSARELRIPSVWMFTAKARIAS